MLSLLVSKPKFTANACVIKIWRKTALGSKNLEEKNHYNGWNTPQKPDCFSVYVLHFQFFLTIFFLLLQCFFFVQNFSANRIWVLTRCKLGQKVPSKIILKKSLQCFVAVFLSILRELKQLASIGFACFAPIFEIQPFWHEQREAISYQSMARMHNLPCTHLYI